jgi:rubrerythrin
MQVAPTSVLRRHAEREIADGRAAIDVIADLEAKGMTSKEAEQLVGRIVCSECGGPVQEDGCPSCGTD